MKLDGISGERFFFVGCYWVVLCGEFLYRSWFLCRVVWLFFLIVVCERVSDYIELVLRNIKILL